MKRMLINATQQEEIRVALVDGQQLYDLDIEPRQRERLKDSIYKGRIAKVEPSLQAAFVEIGEGRQAFLPLKAISPEYLKPEQLALDQEKRHINSILKAGQELIIQVEKEERGNKGAAVTSYVSIAGRYIVLMPNNPRAGGVSRRIEGEEREVTREQLSQLDLPNGMGVIIRTSGVGRSVEELQWDLDHLLRLWESVRSAAEQRTAPALLFTDSDLMSRAIRDYLSPDIGEILVDDEQAFKDARDFVAQMSPNLVSCVKHYSQKVPLFSSFQIESQIESAYRHRVSLPSGGSVVIERTEALVAIDVNSGRSTAGADIEETALSTNMEAVIEASRQLRLRDIGGLIVLDLIDMASSRHRRRVEQAMEEALTNDRARTQVQRISRFGLLEMTRERLGASLEETSTQLCPRCSGQGRIRDVPSTALSILRLSEEQALKRESSMVRARVPLEVASFLLNEKRSDLAEIEQATGTHLVIIPTPHLETPHFEIERIRESDAAGVGDVPSYELVEPPSTPPASGRSETRRDKRPTQPAVVPSQREPSPAMPPARGKTASAEEANGNAAGLLTVLRKSWTSLFSASDSEPQVAEAEPRPKPRSRSGKPQRQRARREPAATAATGSTRQQPASKAAEDGQKTGKKASRNTRDSSGRGDKGERTQNQAGAKERRAPRRQERQDQGQTRDQPKAASQPKASRRPRAKPNAEKQQAESADKAAHQDAEVQHFTPPADGETKRKPRRSRSGRTKSAERAPKANAEVIETPQESPEDVPVASGASGAASVPSAPVESSAPSAPVESTPAEANTAVEDIEAAPSTPEAPDAQVEKKPSRATRTRRPPVKISAAPASFEIEISETERPAPAHEAPPRAPTAPSGSSSIRLTNDPRQTKPSDDSPAFELEES